MNGLWAAAEARRPGPDSVSRIARSPGGPEAGGDAIDREQERCLVHLLLVLIGGRAITMQQLHLLPVRGGDGGKLARQAAAQLGGAFCDLPSTADFQEHLRGQMIFTLDHTE